MKKICIIFSLLFISIVFSKNSFSSDTISDDVIAKEFIDELHFLVKKYEAPPPIEGSVKVVFIRNVELSGSHEVVVEVRYKSDDGKCVGIFYSSLIKDGRGGIQHRAGSIGSLAALDKNLGVEEYKNYRREWISYVDKRVDEYKKNMR